MSISYILNVVFVVLTLIAGFASIYYKSNGKLNKVVAQYINEAETLYKDAQSGGTKMQYVVGKLYGLIPAAIRPFIPEAVIQILVQTAFNEIDSYAKKQIDHAVDKAIPDNVNK